MKDKVYKIGCSPLTDEIFAGWVTKDDKGEIWQGQRKDVTTSAPLAVAQHLMQKNQTIQFRHKNGKRYELKVIEIVEPETEEVNE